MSEKSLRTNCSMAKCFPEKSCWCWNEHVCQGMKRKALWRSKGLDTPLPEIYTVYIYIYIYI